MRLYCTQTLPEGYRLILRIDLQEDKKLMLRVNAAALGLMLAVFLLGLPLAPAGGRLPDLLREGVSLGAMAVFLAGTFAYVILHELTHAAVMKLCGAKKLRFGFTGVYAFAGSEEDYFSKRAHRIIALAPVLCWGFLFALLCVLLPPDGLFRRELSRPLLLREQNTRRRTPALGYGAGCFFSDPASPESQSHRTL